MFGWWAFLVENYPADSRRETLSSDHSPKEARPGKGCIVLSPKVAPDKVDVEKRLAEAEADLKAGRVHGPFGSVKEMLSSLRGEKLAKEKHA